MRIHLSARTSYWCFITLALISACAPNTWGCPGGCGGGSKAAADPSDAPRGYGRGGGSTTSTDNYAQKMCPVCGGQLGARGPVLPVETVSLTKPTILQKMFGKRPQGVVISACSPECATQIKSRPGPFLLKVMEECNSGGMHPRPAQATSNGYAISAPASQR